MLNIVVVVAVISVVADIDVVGTSKNEEQAEEKKRRRKKSRVAITTNCIVTRKLRDYSVRANHRATTQYMWTLW